LEQFLHKRNFKRYSTTQIYSKLRDLGALDGQFKIKGACIRWWSMPVIYSGQDEEFDLPIEIGEAF
jgi:hypothetical protein